MNEWIEQLIGAEPIILFPLATSKLLKVLFIKRFTLEHVMVTIRLAS